MVSRSFTNIDIFPGKVNSTLKNSILTYHMQKKKPKPTFFYAEKVSLLLMIKNLHSILLLLVALVAIPTTQFAQNFPVKESTIAEGELMLTVISEQIIRVQWSEQKEFAETPEEELPDWQPKLRIAQHEDRLRLESPFFTFIHIPQKGISLDVSPWVNTPFIPEKIFLLSEDPMNQRSVNHGVLIIDNREQKFLPVSPSAEADRIIIFSNNNFNEAIDYLQNVTGRNIHLMDACRTPQIYFKPVKGKALMQIESAPGATIYYTTDGSMPTYFSEKYNQPVTLNHSAAVRAFATCEEMLPSAIGEAQIVMSKAREIKWRHSYSENFCGLGEYALMDGLSGDPDDYTLNWIGIPDKDLSVEVELNKPTTISMLGIRFLQQAEEGIFIPEKVTIEVSCDGRRFQRVYRHRVKPPDAPYHHWTHAITARFRARDVKYIRIYADVNDELQLKETFLEGSRWIFVDELIYEQHPQKEASDGCKLEK
ncbi:MAG: hypothetical protein C0593_01650 [Marinilabiliales bacterium]|nr:MAG: hypothetical protein C0593_01650 [Marinilabiliales bacterium]